MKALAFVLTIIFVYANGQNEGEYCVNKITSKNGRCILINKCESARIAIQKREFPQICSFVGKIPIVCCEDAVTTMQSTITTQSTTVTTQRPTSTTRTYKVTTNQPLVPGEISKQKCDEYGAYEYDGEVNNNSCEPRTVTPFKNEPNTRLYEFSHQALLGYENGQKKIWRCSGTLVSELYVLTAAHCTFFTDIGNVKYIRLGNSNMEPTNNAQSIDLNVAEVINHSDYKAPSLYNDIALLKMDRPVKFNKNIRPACLQTRYEIYPDKEVYAPEYFIATGWIGAGSIGGKDSRLTKSVIKKLNVENCDDIYHNDDELYQKITLGTIPDLQFCSGNNDTCLADSGGPLLVPNEKMSCMYNVIAVTSSKTDCSKNIPGIHTRVSYYINWIEHTIWL